MNRFLLFTFACLVWAARLAAQTDTLPPQLVCKSFITQPVGDECLRWISLYDMILSLSDNLDDSAEVELGVRKVCTGSGFPENSPDILLRGGEYTLQIAEVWARDAAGNTASVRCSLHVWDSYHYCDPAIWIVTDRPDAKGIAQATVNVAGSHCAFASFQYQLPTVAQQTFYGYGGTFQMGTIAPAAGYEFTITPTKDINPLNGISTLDLALIQKHVLGAEPLDSPYKIIAADTNQDGQVTTFDVLLLKKLLLGTLTELPNGRSWRFVPQQFVFPNPANPFETPFPERIVVSAEDPLYWGAQLFYGVKIGDVNYSANTVQ